jgi:predicted small lipoprotein YifL
MTFVSQFRKQTTCLMLLALLGACACNGPAGVPGDESSATADQHQAPFHDEASRSVASSPAKLLNTSDQSAKPEKLPFQEENLPAGTLLTVSLKSTVSAGNSTHNTFEAVVDEPVAIAGNTLIARGTTVSGRIQSVRTSNVEPDRGYICLALASIHVGGIDVPVQTADLYARQSQTTSKPSSGLRLAKGRRLTFRLTEPAYVSSQRALSH